MVMIQTKDEHESEQTQQESGRGDGETRMGTNIVHPEGRASGGASRDKARRRWRRRCHQMQNGARRKERG